MVSPDPRRDSHVVFSWDMHIICYTVKDSPVAVPSLTPTLSYKLTPTYRVFQQLGKKFLGGTSVLFCTMGKETEKLWNVFKLHGCSISLSFFLSFSLSSPSLAFSPFLYINFLKIGLLSESYFGHWR